MTPMRKWIAAAAVVAVAALVVANRELLSDFEEPSHRVLRRDGPFEIREYEPAVAAEVLVPGEDRAQAANTAFRVLFDYISGENTTRTAIEMTAPVTTSRPEEQGVSISITAPVTQVRDPEGWRVRFFLPGSYTLETAPAPLDPDVRVVTVPARRVVAMRFSGRASEAAFDARHADLLDYVRQEGLKPIGEPAFAQYNSPFVLPFWRRNELLWPLPA